MSRSAQRKMMLFGKSLADLQRLPGMPTGEMQVVMSAQGGTSSMLSVDGMSVEPTTSGTAQPVIGAVSQQTLKPVPTRSVLSEGEIKTLPALSSSGMTCCGYMDVTGIQPAMLTNRSIEDIILGLHVYIYNAQEIFKKRSADLDEVSRQRSEFMKEWRKDHPEADRSGVYDDPKYQEFNLRIEAIDRERYNNQKTTVAGAWLFTYTGEPRYTAYGLADKLKKFCNEHGLGTVTYAPPFYNPNSANMVYTVILGLIQEGYWKFIRERLPKKYHMGH